MPTPTTPPAARGAARGATGGQKIMGMPPVFFYGAVAGVAALVWMVYKSRKAGAAGSGTGTQPASTGSCTDANGNPTPCTELAGVDYSGQLSTEQTELEALLSQTSPAPTPAPTPAPAAPTQVDKYPNVSFTARPQNSSTILITFHALTSPTPLPTSYTVEAWQLNGKVAAQQTINAPDTSGGNGAVTLSGLHPAWCYKIRLWANGGKQAPDSMTPQVCMPPDGHRR